MQQSFLVKTINKKTIEAEGKLVKNTKLPKPPLWFANWTENFEKRINKRFDKIDKRINNLVVLNNLKES